MLQELSTPNHTTDPLETLKDELRVLACSTTERYMLAAANELRTGNEPTSKSLEQLQQCAYNLAQTALREWDEAIMGKRLLAIWSEIKDYVNELFTENPDITWLMLGEDSRQVHTWGNDDFIPNEYSVFIAEKNNEERVFVIGKPWQTDGEGLSWQAVATGQQTTI